MTHRLLLRVQGFAALSTGFVDHRPWRDLVALALSAVLVAGCAGSDETGLGIDLVSEEQVQQMGIESWQRIRSETRVSEDEAAQQTADEVADNLLQAAGADPGEWEVVVFQSDQANAFALPGGKIGIYEGMLQAVQNEAQLAAVVAHEIGHLQADHARERVSSEVATQGVVQLVSAALQVGNVAYANAIAGALGAGAQYGVLLPYSRNQELEADRIGLQLMAQAGYDPREALAFWQQMQQQQGGGEPPAFLSTHPTPGNRIEQLQELMPAALETYRGNA
jgi:predicted Zn-dependent protease